MSYVRWSTPIHLPDGVDPMEYFSNPERYWDLPTSDFYIYDSVGDFVSVNVAGNRHLPKAPFDGKRGQEGWFEWLDKDREPIDHPDAGETFEFTDMADAIEKVEQLIGEGFLAPDWLLASMREGDG